MNANWFLPMLIKKTNPSISVGKAEKHEMWEVWNQLTWQSVQEKKTADMENNPIKKTYRNGNLQTKW